MTPPQPGEKGNGEPVLLVWSVPVTGTDLRALLESIARFWTERIGTVQSVAYSLQKSMVVAEILAPREKVQQSASREEDTHLSSPWGWVRGGIGVTDTVSQEDVYSSEDIRVNELLLHLSARAEGADRLQALLYAPGTDLEAHFVLDLAKTFGVRRVEDPDMPQDTLVLCFGASPLLQDITEAHTMELPRAGTSSSTGGPGSGSMEDAWNLGE